jgi:uncharacterized NAD(P)/FAD-binding protein YdhS
LIWNFYHEILFTSSRYYLIFESKPSISRSLCNQQKRVKTAPVIAIIGGGFCGTLTLVQLLRQAKKPLQVVLVNKNYPLSKGIAYSTADENHLLNVAAGKMSAFPEDPDHFINWIRNQKTLKDFVSDELNLAYLPRYVYGNYLQDILDEALKKKPSFVDCSILNDEAKDIVRTVNKYKIVLHGNKAFAADKIVLATGNSLPSQLPVKDERFYTSQNYFGNPWDKSATENIKPDETVLIIGTGLTMLDTALSVARNGFRGKIIALSRSGLLPLFHKRRKPYLQLLDDLKPPYRLQQLYEVYFKHIVQAAAQGNPTEALVDAIRPRTQEIWMGLSLPEKIQFMTHIKHFWNVTRHRAAKEVYDSISKLREKNMLEVVAGRLISMAETGNDIEIIFREKKTLKERIIKVNRVINCTGPETDITKVNDTFIKNLLKHGYIVPDELKLGMNALPDGTIIHKDNSLSSFLFTIGTNLKGILWESTAVPELRLQAQQLATELLNLVHSVKTTAKKKAKA